MIRVIPFIYFISIFTNIFGQSQELKGEIIADSLEGFAINIVNYTKKIGATNDERGLFKIPASINDSIIFSSVQYEVATIVISEKDLENENFQIRLVPVIQKLDQVNVSNINLSGDISKDTKDIKVNPHFDNRILGLQVRNIKQPTLEVRRIYTARSGPIDLLVNSLNGKLKKLKKIKEFTDLDLIVKKGENAFTTAFFVDDLGLPENLISDFMYYCAEDSYFENLLENSKRLSLLKFFEKKVTSYKKYKEID